MAFLPVWDERTLIFFLPLIWLGLIHLSFWIMTTNSSLWNMHLRSSQICYSVLPNISFPHKVWNCEVWKIIVYPSATATPHNSSGGLSVPYSCLPHMTPLWGSYHWDALTGLSAANYSTATVNTVIPLTDWGRDKMSVIFQTTFSNAFSWMKMYEFRLKFHWICF